MNDLHRTPRAGVQDIDDAFYLGKVILLRVDFDIPLSSSVEDTHSAINDGKIRESMDTVHFLLQRGATVLLISCQGGFDWPDVDLCEPQSTEVTENFTKYADPNHSLKRVMHVLRNLLDEKYSLEFCEDCIGPRRLEIVQRLKRGELSVCLLESCRFYREELRGDPSFGFALADGIDLFVNDAFSACNMAHCSVSGIKPFLKAPSLALAGFQLQRELAALTSCLVAPRRPFSVMIGGMKVVGKLNALRFLVFNHADQVLIAGATCFPFLRARGLNVGSAAVDQEEIREASAILNMAKNRSVQIVLPVDFVCVPNHPTESSAVICNTGEIPDEFSCLDIGPSTIATFASLLETSKAILWSGPLGVYEKDGFDQGTNRLIDTLSDLTAKGVVTVLLGEKTVDSVERHLHLNDKARFTVASGGHGREGAHSREYKCFTHVSLAGAAALDFLGNIRMPGLDALSFKVEIPESLRSPESANREGVSAVDHGKKSD